jgi:ABC-type multidrug transport system ATPase subunit
VVLVNGRQEALERYKPVMGYVPQEDVMHRKLSVEENLLFAARFRLPSHFSHQDHIYYVEQAMEVRLEG